VDGSNRGLALAGRNFHEQYDKDQPQVNKLFTADAGGSKNANEMVIDPRARID